MTMSVSVRVSAFLLPSSAFCEGDAHETRAEQNQGYRLWTCNLSTRTERPLFKAIVRAESSGRSSELTEKSQVRCGGKTGENGITDVQEHIAGAASTIEGVIQL